MKLTLELKMKLLAKDEVEMFDPDNGPVYMCAEKACKSKAPHAHSKRPYLAWSEEQMCES